MQNVLKWKIFSEQPAMCAHVFMGVHTSCRFIIGPGGPGGPGGPRTVCPSTPLSPCRTENGHYYLIIIANNYV